MDARIVWCGLSLFVWAQVFGDTFRTTERNWPAPFLCAYKRMIKNSNMETSVILLSSFVALVGLQLSVPDGDVEKMADNGMMGCPWCPSPILKIIYGLSQLAGVAFCLGFAAYLTFAEHWWYLLVYIGGVMLAKVTAILLHIPLLPLFKLCDEGLFSDLRIKRFVGTLLIWIGFAICMASL